MFNIEHETPFFLLPMERPHKKSYKAHQSDTEFRVLALVNTNPSMTQREMAKASGVSLGSLNYCLKALMEKGWVKVNRFKHNPDKSVYLYLLTPEGIAQKSRLAVDFLKRKQAEFELIRAEIERVKRGLLP